MTADIALTQLVLWYDPTRIQTWPRLLAQVSPDEEFVDMTDFTKRRISDRSQDEKHGAYIDLARGLPGLEVTPRGFVLRGVGLFKKDGVAYRLSSTGSELAAAYRRDAGKDAWVVRLARLLVSREPRLRVLLKQLSLEGSCLVFKGDGWFQGPAGDVRFFAPGAEAVFPFRDQPGSIGLRSWLVEAAWWALGEWRQDPLLESFAGVRFVGQLKPDFTLDRIGLRLRPALEVLLYLGIIRHSGAEAWLDHEAAARLLGESIAEDFPWQNAKDLATSTPIQILAEETERLRLDTGLVVASELRQALHDRGFTNPDKAIAEFIKDGFAALEGQEYGQGRHGRGLYGDPAKQLIRLRIHSFRS